MLLHSVVRTATQLHSLIVRRAPPLGSRTATQFHSSSMLLRWVATATVAPLLGSQEDWYTATLQLETMVDLLYTYGISVQ